MTVNLMFMIAQNLWSLVTAVTTKAITPTVVTPTAVILPEFLRIYLNLHDFT